MKTYNHTVHSTWCLCAEYDQDVVILDLPRGSSLPRPRGSRVWAHQDFWIWASVNHLKGHLNSAIFPNCAQERHTAKKRFSNTVLNHVHARYGFMVPKTWGCPWWFESLLPTGWKPASSTVESKYHWLRTTWAMFALLDSPRCLRIHWI